jgi:hypothetical protein
LEEILSRKSFFIPSKKNAALLEPRPVGLGDEIAFPGFERGKIRGEFKAPGVFSDHDRVRERNTVENRQKLMVSVRPFTENTQMKIKFGRTFENDFFHDPSADGLWKSFKIKKRETGSGER